MFTKYLFENEVLMEKKLKYIAPAITDEIKIEMEGSILAASHVNEPIEEDVEVVSMGHDEVKDWEFTWEF